MTAALGYALWGLYKEQNEERKTWLDKWEAQLKASDEAQRALAEEVRAHMRETSETLAEIKRLVER